MKTIYTFLLLVFTIPGIYSTQAQYVFPLTNPTPFLPSNMSFGGYAANGYYFHDACYGDVGAVGIFFNKYNNLHNCIAVIQGTVAGFGFVDSFNRMSYIVVRYPYHGIQTSFGSGGSFDLINCYGNWNNGIPNQNVVNSYTDNNGNNHIVYNGREYIFSYSSLGLYRMLPRDTFMEAGIPSQFLYTSYNTPYYTPYLPVSYFDKAGNFYLVIQLDKLPAAEQNHDSLGLALRAVQVLKVDAAHIRRILSDTDTYTHYVPVELVAGRPAYVHDYHQPLQPSPDGIAATQAELGYILDMDKDSLGNLYLSDVGFNCIWKVSPNGIFSKVAGLPTAGGAAIRTGTSPNGYPVYAYNTYYGGGDSGDGGPATAAALNAPLAKLDRSERYLYISDIENYRIRRVDLSTGIISNFMGTSGAFTNGTFPCYDGDWGPLANARSAAPILTGVDSYNNLYISDALQYCNTSLLTSPNYVLRKVCMTRSIITIDWLGRDDSNRPCMGDSVTFIASIENGIEPLPYIWVLNGSRTGDTSKYFTYVPRYGDQLYCYTPGSIRACSTDSSHVKSNTIIMPDRPTCSLSASNNGIVVEGSSITLTASSNTATLYRWMVNGGERAATASNTYTYIPQNSDEVYAIAQAGINCPTDTAHSNRISIQTTPNSINDLSKEPLRLSPNPAQQFISCNNTAGIQYTLMSIEGKILAKGQLKVAEPISIAAFAPGMYIVEVQLADKSRQQFKFVKE